MVSQISAEAFVAELGPQADVLVHMVSVDAIPLDIGICDQRLQHIVLGGSSSEDHVDLSLFAQQLPDLVVNIHSSDLTHLITGGHDLDLKIVFYEFFHSVSPFSAARDCRAAEV